MKYMAFGEPLGGPDDGYLWNYLYEHTQPEPKDSDSPELIRPLNTEYSWHKVPILPINSNERCFKCNRKLAQIQKETGQTFVWKIKNRYYYL